MNAATTTTSSWLDFSHIENHNYRLRNDYSACNVDEDNYLHQRYNLPCNRNFTTGHRPRCFYYNQDSYADYNNMPGLVHKDTDLGRFSNLSQLLIPQSQPHRK